MSLPQENKDVYPPNLGNLHNTNGATPEQKLAEVDALLAMAMLPDKPKQDPAAQELENFLLSAPVDDDGNSQCLVRMFPDRFLCCDAFGWLVYLDGYWRMANAEAALEAAIVEVLRRRVNAAMGSFGNGGQADTILKICKPNRNRIEGTKALLRHKVAAEAGDFDQHRDLLNCANGVVDLRTGELLPHSPAYKFMHRTAARYNPAANSGQWVTWLRESIEHPADVDWLQEFFGYSITGHTREDCLLHVWGPPRSGKGTLAGAISAALGGRLAMGLSFSTLTAPHDRDSQGFAFAPLQPARLVVASEMEEGQRLNGARVKMLTGGDKVHCSFKGRDHFDYTPQWKIVLLTNPELDADPADNALWARVHSIQFPHSHEGVEDRLLRDSWQTPESQEAILAWMVEGAKIWYARGGRGLPRLASSIEHKQERRKELDSVAKWLDESTAADPAAKVQRTILYKSYVQWCEDNGHSPLGNNRFGKAMAGRGHEYKKLREGAATFRGYEGISLVE